MDEVREDQRHQHQHVGDSLVDRRPCESAVRQKTICRMMRRTPETTEGL